MDIIVNNMVSFRSPIGVLAHLLKVTNFLKTVILFILSVDLKIQIVMFKNVSYTF